MAKTIDIEIMMDGHFVFISKQIQRKYEICGLNFFQRSYCTRAIDRLKWLGDSYFYFCNCIFHPHAPLRGTAISHYLNYHRNKNFSVYP